MLGILASALASFALGWWIPRRASILFAALAWPAADWFKLLPGATHPTVLVLVPAALCALAAFAGVGMCKARAVSSLPRSH